MTYESWRISYQSSEAAAPQAVQASVPVGTKFFSFDPCDDLVVHDTAEAACAAAQQSIDLYREYAAEGWAEEVDRVCWGTILGQALETKLSEDLPPDAFAAGVAGSLPPVDYVLHAPAHPAEGVPALAGTYAEARECEHCNHVGINDAANGIASCMACKWNGDSPKEDKCPDCEAEGAMTASCPKCHHEYRLIADATLAATHPTQQGLDAQTTRDAVIQHLTNAGVLEHDGCGIFIASGDASELIDACMALSTHAHHEKGAAAQAAALLTTGGQAQAVKLLAADHSGMKVNYRGLFSQVQRALKRTDPGHAEMLRQLESHLQELGQRWYAGDTDVVDEMLQLYCIECDARKTLGASATAAAQAK